MKLYDISQELFSSTVFPGDVPPTFSRVMTIPKDVCNLTTLSMCVHNGTHMDSPRHFIQDGKTVEELPLSIFYGECLVAEFQGLISKVDILPVLAAGCERLLLKGACEISEEAAVAITESKVRLIGVESQSVGNSNAPRAVHVILLGHEVTPLEGLRLGEVPEGKYWLSAFPVNLAGSDGAPVRAVLADFSDESQTVMPGSDGAPAQTVLVNFTDESQTMVQSSDGAPADTKLPSRADQSSMRAQSCEDFVHALASKAPVPGGGGAAALVGAVGTALGNMVGSLTIGKKKYADVWEEIGSLKGKADQLQEDLLTLIERDAQVFEPLSRAYSLPKGTPEEIAHKEQVMEAALREACSVPMEIMAKSCEAIDLLQDFAAKGTAIAISDAGCGAACTKAALQSAALNVFINTKGMKDRNYAEALNQKAKEMLKTYVIKADEIYQLVTDKVI
jgi:formiminotetrahydrofolate cyclodeaminase/kynurenine formamidase